MRADWRAGDVHRIETLLSVIVALAGRPPPLNAPIAKSADEFFGSVGTSTTWPAIVNVHEAQSVSSLFSTVQPFALRRSETTNRGGSATDATRSMAPMMPTKA